MHINKKDVSKAHLTNSSKESLKKLDLRTMTTIHKHKYPTDAFDILFKNFFNNESFFVPVVETKIGHPLDIYEDSEGLHFQIAGTGLTKDDITISIEGDVLKVSYAKKENPEHVERILSDRTTENKRNYFHKGISRKSFDLGYRIPLSKYDLSKAEAAMEHGLLTIDIPVADEAKPKTLTIK